jgi:plastocyanin domain-containing protein
MRHAIVMLVAIFAFAGCAKAPPAETTDAGTAETAAPPAAGEARVAVTVDGQGFHPDRIDAKVGEPVTLVLTRTTDETCGTEIVIPALSINQKIPLNQPVEVTVTPQEKGTIAFACGMDMLKGTIVVE